MRSTQRHSHTYFGEEPTGSFAACYEVSRCYAGDGSLRLERRSSQPRHGRLRFKRHSVGDGSPRFGRRSPHLRHYSGDRSLHLGRRSSQPRHGGLRTRHRPPPATRRAVVRLLRQHVAPIREGVLLLHLPAMRWRLV